MNIPRSEIEGGKWSKNFVDCYRSVLFCYVILRSSCARIDRTLDMSWPFTTWPPCRQKKNIIPSRRERRVGCTALPSICDFSTTSVPTNADCRLRCSPAALTSLSRWVPAHAASISGKKRRGKNFPRRWCCRGKSARALGISARLQRRSRIIRTSSSQ